METVLEEKLKRPKGLATRRSCFLGHGYLVSKKKCDASGRLGQFSRAGGRANPSDHGHEIVTLPLARSPNHDFRSNLCTFPSR